MTINHPEQIPTHHQQSGKPCILVAEDSKSNQLYIRLVLKRLGYDADMVSDGLAVLDAIQSKPYDLIFMDIFMPEMDGLEVTQTIRQQGNNSIKPWIVALTAHPNDRYEYAQLGMNDYVSKPVSLQSISDVFDRYHNSHTLEHT